MRFLFYTHSAVSDWNHGNAHFQRGIMRELVARGHGVAALEPADGWSRSNLIAEQGPFAVERFRKDFPELMVAAYDPGFEHEAWLAGADVVIVHEWTDKDLVARIGRARAYCNFTLLFHDTHHRAVSATEAIAALQLEHYDGVLVFGEVLRESYLRAGWGRRVFTWHEAADDRLFKPLPEIDRESDLVWIGNWGDDERSAEIAEFLIEPARALGLLGTVHGVRYPADAITALADAGLRYEGWIANADVPKAFARHRVTMHIPRRPYRESLPGIPTIRMFEALACGIPLVSAPWADVEGLFRAGTDFLFARSGAEMRGHLRDVVNDRELAEALAASGLETILARHTCRHRADELFAILAACGNRGATEIKPATEAAA
ncbi:glycosyltransferase [Mesorhizobium sp. M2D.F.Ca.ET.185.01.1.1]|uniref:CgeB family protein n=2 Tax=Mesorhizobium TaxID=68287 RepID=UPI000FC9FEF7|nr:MULTISPECIES: glycosyltransferase [unclassified Mesorhizobium]TGP82852.1 glycosyltransferase [bacterium M00.F.Ca.ET.227.01.1.1]TGP94594.1 glycosyltransferase [bacterium M00.F.Ca.ET.221.01.1.1]TGP98048.1 glycosyltransferase [bacterium M00.F.Ca.ET.222.01.1.1]TGU02150.1 glycosyltransferase [bacterium M00.F.Ca.ET.163.01.1.1]TGU19583.1 glycosyltransferase [bacterium M00.F.Ca.ET.156.01.1.1]TGU49030.1 glycosyltransferase [bacterium M00.F.Ca.ET.146.01.1.1]TGV70849.1 glycosyltransferase [Mesorhizo